MLTTRYKVVLHIGDSSLQLISELKLEIARTIQSGNAVRQLGVTSFKLDATGSDHISYSFETDLVDRSILRTIRSKQN